jgi:hypothetical protein
MSNKTKERTKINDISNKLAKKELSPEQLLGVRAALRFVEPCSCTADPCGCEDVDCD